MFCKRGILKVFAKFTEKRLCQSLYFNKVVSPQACNFLKKRALTQVFSCDFYKIFKNNFFYRKPLVAASVIKLY